MQLNTEQELAANHVDGPCLCTAVPGSGKTRVIVERTARMIQKGVDPKSILAITFTNKAANEMKARVAKRVGEETSKQIFIATFHRLASTILRSKHGKLIGYDRNMTILDEDDQVSLMLQTARQLEFELTRPEVKKIVWVTNDWRENLGDDDDLYEYFEKMEKTEWYNISAEYIKRINANNQIDFSGMLSETYRLLKDHPQVVEAAQARWKYFMVDEVQDTNLAQFKIIDLLCSHTKNIFVVGDLDQSIYGWRGARSENVTDFQKKYGGKVISLGKNYRSTPQIIKAADKLIRHNEERIDVNFSTDNPDGVPVLCKAFATDLAEADMVAKTVKQIIASGKYTGKDIAVFYRMNSMSRAIEMAMIANQVPHTVIGNFSFFDRKEIKDCFAMLRFLCNPKDGISFHRIANKPKRALGDTTVGKIELFAKDQNCTILEALKNIHLTAQSVRNGISEILNAYSFDPSKMTVAEVLTKLVKELNYEQYLKDEDEDGGADRIENIQELIRDAARFTEEKGGDVADYLEHIALATASDKSAEGDAVSLMSLHASKGLEFPVVFMLGVEQNILPHKKAVEERADGMQEERRLCYVGMTRAKNILSMSYCMKRQDGFAATKGKVNYKASMPSQFLRESGLLKEQPKQAAPQASDFDAQPRKQGYQRSNWDYCA